MGSINSALPVHLKARYFLPLFMPRLLLVFIVLTGCTSKMEFEGEYLGILKLSTRTFQLYLNLEDNPSIQNVTFKAQEFPLDTLYRKNDSLFFVSEDHTVAYRGKYDRLSKSITGQWIIEDTIFRKLDFVPVNPDTLKGMHPRTTPYVYNIPAAMDDGLSVSSLDEAAINKDSMSALTQKVIDGKYADIHSLLVARHGHLIYEEYFYNYHRDHVYNIQSANKSLVSALVGIAIAKGEIKSTASTLCQYLKGYESLACNEQNKDIELEGLLTMNTGIPWDEQTFDYADERNGLAIAANERDQFVYLLSKPRSPASGFAYNSLNHLLINAVLKEATGLDNRTELLTRLLTPLGIKDYDIPEETPMGVIGDIGLRQRDMMKFGLLYQNKGNWQGEQLIPEEWISLSTSPKIQVTDALSYGYFWWTKEFDYKGERIGTYFAWGYGGQYIVVIPTLELVVVMSGSHWTTHPEGQGLEIVQEVVNAVMS